MPGNTVRTISLFQPRRLPILLGTLALGASVFSAPQAWSQVPNDPPKPVTGLQTLLPQQAKDLNAFVNPQMPPTPTQVIPNSSGTETLGLAPVSNQIITKIYFKGNRRMVEEQLKNMISCREGQPFSAEKLRNDVRMLDASGRYLGGVRVEEYNTNEGKVLTFHVFERALIEDVVYEGARHMGRDDLELNTGIKKGMPMNPAINRVAAQRLEQAYHNKGRWYAQVYLAEGGRPEDTRVVFQITEGPAVRVAKVDIVGANFVSAARLPYGTKMDTGAGFLGMFGSDYNPLQLEQDMGKILEYYRSWGFMDVKVRKSVRPGEDPSSVIITVVIDEGPRYLVQNVEVQGNRKIEPEILLAHNVLKQGDVYTTKDMQASLVRMQDEYNKRGFINTRIAPEFKHTTQPGIVTVVYKVDEGQGTTYAGEIKVVGNSVTRDDVIRNQLRIYPGQILDGTKIRESERNLARLGIFNMMNGGPRIFLEDADGPSPYKNVIVQVEEDRTGSLNVGAAVGSDAGVNAQISLTERNFDILRIPTSWEDFSSGRAFRGGGQSFSIRAQPGNQFSNYSVSWTDPSIFNSDYSLTLGGYYFNRFFTEYHEQRLGGRIGVGKRLDDAWFFNVGFRAESITADNIPVGAPIDYQQVKGDNSLFAPRISFVRDTRDSFLRATEGNKFEIGFEQAFGSYNFPIFTVEDSQYFTVYQRPDGSGRHVLVLHGVFGASTDEMPVYERWFLGGARNIRGFAFRGAGPDVNGYKVGGRLNMVGNVEYQVPLTANDQLMAVAFCDFGTVESDLSIRDFRVSVGAGLRINVPMLSPAPIALDFGFPLVSKETDLRQVFQFTVAVSY
ncbi:MAG: outer membrane protein assembly factor BamA [Gemmatales bacterium]